MQEDNASRSEGKRGRDDFGASNRSREGVLATAWHTESALGRFVRQNAAPLSLIGLGLGLLVWIYRRKADLGHFPDPSVVGRSEVYEDLDEDEDAAWSGTGARDLGPFQARVRGGVASLKHTAADTAHQARAQLARLEHGAGRQAQRARVLAEWAWDEQPLVLATLAVGVGLAVGIGSRVKRARS